MITGDFNSNGFADRKRCNSNAFGSRIDFEPLTAALIPHIVHIILSIDPDPRLSNNKLWFADPNNSNDKETDSASINVKSGHWNARANGNKGRDVVSLVAYLKGLSQSDAGRLAANIAGVDLPGGPRRSYARTAPSAAKLHSSNSHESSHSPDASGSAEGCEAKKESAARLWAEGKAISGTVGEAYLRSRSIDPADVAPDELRFISDLHYFHGNNPDGSPRKIGTYPAILAPVRNRVSDEVTAVLRIWLKPDGSGKA